MTYQEIERMLQHAELVIKHCKIGTVFSKKSTTPQHLVYDIRRISAIWESTQTITPQDAEFMQHIYNSSNEYLLSHAYILGNWHKWKAHTFTNLRMPRKRPKYPSKKLRIAQNR